jgi:hypothetical protein
LNGAFKAAAQDFDEDGDLDIAAISFPTKSHQRRALSISETGEAQFTASTFSQCIAGRWLTMDVGDLDLDGDSDIVLGSYIRGPSDVPEKLAVEWEKGGPSVVILRNTLK